MLPTTIHHLKSTGGKFRIMIGFILLNPIRFPASNIKSFSTIHSRCPKMLPSLESSSLQKRNVQIKCKCPPTHDTYQIVTGTQAAPSMITKDEVFTQITDSWQQYTQLGASQYHGQQSVTQHRKYQGGWQLKWCSQLQCNAMHAIDGWERSSTWHCIPFNLFNQTNLNCVSWTNCNYLEDEIVIN